MTPSSRAIAESFRKTWLTLTVTTVRALQTGWLLLKDLANLTKSISGNRHEYSQRAGKKQVYKGVYGICEVVTGLYETFSSF